MSYIYDDIIEGHLQKAAFWGAAARGLMKAAPSAAKFGLGAATGLPVGKAGAAGAMAGAVHGMMPSVTRGNAGPTFMGMGPKVAAYSRREKLAEHGWGSKLLHVSPYAAWAAGHLVEDSHPTLSKALSAGAYLGYAGSSAHEAATNPAERATSGVDAMALMAMLGSDIARWTRK